MSEILFIKTSSLGDVIHQMPAVTDARRCLPQARFSWVVEEAFAPLVALHPAVDEVIPVAWRRWRWELHRPAGWREIKSFVHKLRARSYQEIVDTQGLARTGVIAGLARGRRHGYDVASVRERLASSFYDVRHAVARGLHAITRNRMLTASALGYVLDDDLGAPGDFGLDRERLAGELSPQAAGSYGILLHATAQATKEWPEQSWIELARMLGDAALLIPWGTESERARSLRLAMALPNARVPDRAPLDEVARLIAGARFVVGVDTGLLHLAAALGVSLVGIFAGSEPGLTGPRGRGAIAIVGGKGAAPAPKDVAAALAGIAR